MPAPTSKAINFPSELFKQKLSKIVYIPHKLGKYFSLNLFITLLDFYGKGLRVL
jgi:hypothetical protein